MNALSSRLQAPVLKNRSSVNRLAAILFIFILSFQTVSCARIDIVYPSEETATAAAKVQALAPEENQGGDVLVSVSLPGSTATVPPSATAEPVTPTPLSTSTRAWTPTEAPTETKLPTETQRPTATQVMTATQVLTTYPTFSELSRLVATSTKITVPNGGSNTSSNSLSIIAPPILYYTQAGDTLESLSKRFSVAADQITSPDYDEIPSQTLLQSKKLLIIPNTLGETTHGDKLFPDSEIIYSPSAIGFDSGDYVEKAGGHLARFREWRTDGWYNGGEVIQRVAYENSVNPRLLLALVEFQSHWIFGFPSEGEDTSYPLGWEKPEYKDLYKQLTWAIMEVGIGYYGWRSGKVTELTFPDETTLRLAPELNAGTVAVMYLFSKLYNQDEWEDVIYGKENFFALYNSMFDDAWIRAKTVEPFFPTDLEQPELTLPFAAGKTWTLTSGPHAVWGPEGVLGALDFAPPSIASGCLASEEWVTAVASGVVTRAYNGAVVVDLDGDGYEQTGWSIFYMHIFHEGRVQVGDWVNVGDPIGHPSCEGGVSTGTHLHIARKYNGEWIPADGPLPFNLGGWIAHEGETAYLGTLTRGSQTITSDVNSSHISKVTREK